MAGTCITLAEQPAHTTIWSAQAPLAFSADFAALKAEHLSIGTASAAAYADTTGSADDKATAETALENAAFTLARACASYFKKVNDQTHRAQVNFTRSAIMGLRDATLVSTATLIRDLAYAVRSEPGAVDRGITAARINTLNNARDTFSNLLGAPRATITTRGSLIREIETRVAGLMNQLDDLDDLVVQFDGTAAGRTFIGAWKQARQIVDAGHGPGETPVPAPTPAPTP